MRLPNTNYNDEDCLMISAIQHYVFCPRQWQLIHIEMEWQDNDLTALGQILHHRVDTPDLPQQRGKTITLRSVPLVSHRLGIYGISDVVELTPTVEDTCLRHPLYPGRWQATPVEYKKGSPKRHNADKMQLCAEALCLEEMYGITIPVGYLYYGEMKHRLKVPLADTLRSELVETVKVMHRLTEVGGTAPPVYDQRCRRCSLRDLCLPELSQRTNVRSYYHSHHIPLL